MSLRLFYLAAILVLASNVGYSTARCNGVASACDPADTLSYRYPIKACYEAGDKITYTCQRTLKGPQWNICKQNGEWSFPKPDCEVFTCDIPTNHSSVIIEPRKTIYNAREKVQFHCNEGFALEGPHKATCDESNKWNPSTKPLCLKVCQPPIIKNGYTSIKSAMKQGDTTKVACVSGYEIHVRQSNHIKCGDGGEWEHLPECVKKQTAVLPGNDNSLP